MIRLPGMSAIITKTLAASPASDFRAFFTVSGSYDGPIAVWKRAKNHVRHKIKALLQLELVPLVHDVLIMVD